MVLSIRASGALGRDGQLSESLKEYLDSPIINSCADDDKTLILAAARFDRR